MKRLSKLGGTYCTMLLAVFAVAIIAATSTPIWAQVTCSNSLTITKSCLQNRVVGQTDDCLITLTDSDSVCQNTYQVNSGKDVVFGSGGTQTFTGLPMSAVSGTTTCTVGGSLPCNISFGASVTFHDNNYTIVAGDAPTLSDEGTINAQNLCDKNASGCSTTAVDENQVASASVLTCSVHIDKQVSCDGGVTWADADTTTGNQVTGPCTGFSGDPIQVRFVVKNTGTDEIDTCNIHDVVGQTGMSTGGTEYTADYSTGLSALTAGQTVTSNVITVEPNGTTPLTCTPAGPNFDSAEVDCTCKGTAITVKSDDTASFSCETCSVQIDKQVKCDGGSFVDVFGTDDTVSGNADTAVDTCIGLDAYPGHTADPIEVQYVITNTGADGVNTCTYGETNAAITGSVTIPGAPVTIASLGTTTLPFTNPCSPALIANEVSGQDSATISCTCNSLTNNTTVKTVGFKDTAGFTCEAPGLNVTKTCAPQSGTTNAVTVTATNTSTTPTLTLTNCVVSDTYATNTSCPATLPFPNTQTLTPTAPQTLGVAGSGTASFTWTGDITGLTANACNDGSVTCTVGGTTDTITANFEATCPVGKGCETRTPGYWAEHSAVTKAVIDANGGLLENCGLMITDADTGDCSAFEDLCSIGRDANTLGISPVQENLIFQCMAAELNLAVTVLDGGNCGNTIPNSTLLFSDCCGATGACATGSTVNLATVAACQAAVGAFNGLFENCPDPTNPLCTSSTGFLNGSASPADCQTAKNNGLVNDMSATGANLGTSQSDCGGARLYIPKLTGKK